MHPPGLQRFALTRDALRRRRAPTACAEPTTGPHTLATPCPVLPTHSGMTFATRCLMRRVLGFLAGVLVGQWLVFRGGAFAGRSAHSRRHRLGASRLSRGAPALEPVRGPSARQRGAALPARAGAGRA